MAIDTEKLETRRFNLDEFEKMYERGVIGPEERLELIAGALVVMPPTGPDHRTAVMRINDVFARLRGRAHPISQTSVPLSKDDAPEPDFALAKWRDDYYRGVRIFSEGIGAIVEVSHTTLAYDRGEKLRLYARFRIPEYWIANLKTWTIERYRKPNDLGYAEQAIFAPGESLSFEAFGDIEFTVDELLGPRPEATEAD